jgi:hypothetical protein
LQSLFTAYSLTKRINPLPDSLAGYTTITNNIIATSSKSTAKANKKTKSTTSDNYQHLQQYLAYLQSDAVLNDGIINIQKNVIIAAQPDRKQRLLWFRKVQQVNENSVEVL